MHERMPDPRKPHNEEKFAEADFYRDRFKRWADRENQSLLVRSGLREPVTESYAAQIAAEREARDLLRRVSEEYEKWNKSFVRVRDHLLFQRDQPGQEREPDTLALFMGGAQYGAYCAGQIIGLNLAGITPELFKAVGGSSAGSGPPAYWVAGEEQTLIAASLFENECTSKEFLNPRRVHKMIDTSVPARAMRHGPKALDEAAVRAASPEVFAIARDQRTHKTEYIDLKTVKTDIVTALEASSAISPFREGVEIDGKVLEDGGFNEIDLEEIIKIYKPKKILLFPNVPFDFIDTLKYNKTERALIKGASYLSELDSINSIGTLESFLKEKGKLRNLLEKIEQMHGVDIGVMWPPDSGVKTLTTDRDIITSAVIESARDVIDRFGGKQPHEIPSFEGSANAHRNSRPEEMVA